MTASGSDPYPVQRSDGRRRHVGEGILAIFISSYFLFVLSAVVAGIVSTWSTTRTLDALSQLGRQITLDAGWLLPTLVATLALLIGVPLAQARTTEDDPDVARRRVALCSYVIAGAAVTGLELAILGSIGDSAAARRLWSIVVVCGIAVGIALWTGGLVFGARKERLRAALQGLAETTRLLRTSRTADFGPRGLRGSALLRTLLAVDGAVALAGTGIAVLGSGEGLAPAVLTTLIAFGLAMVSTSVPLLVAIAACETRTDPGLPRPARHVLGMLELARAVFIACVLTISFSQSTVGWPLVGGLAFTQLAPLAWGSFPASWGSWTLEALLQSWRFRRLRQRQVSFKRDLRRLRGTDAIGSPAN